MVIHSEKCSDKASASNKEKILMPQSELFKDISLEQWKEEEEDKRHLKNRELEKSLGIALQAIKRLEEIVQTGRLGAEEEEYLAIGGDGRPYIAVRKKQETRQEDQKKPAIG